MIDYKFREGELIEEFKNYVDSTYSAHYGKGGLQSSEVIVDRGHGMGFFSGNVDKYNGRYGKKGTPADHRKDIMKIIHYGFLMLFEHDRINKKEEPEFELTIQEDVGSSTRMSIDDATPEEWDAVSRRYSNYSYVLADSDNDYSEKK